jgi:signal transduction histidine kinase
MELVEDRFEQRGVRLAVVRDPELPRVPADPDRLHEVFLNLAVNAADAMPNGGRVEITLDRGVGRHPERGGPEIGFARVTFADTGIGIHPDHLGRVFDPFFTTKEVGEGTGLGLSISYGIVREHGGWIEVASELGKGARVSVCLPLDAAPARGETREEVA